MGSSARGYWCPTIFQNPIWFVALHPAHTSTFHICFSEWWSVPKDWCCLSVSFSLCSDVVFCLWTRHWYNAVLGVVIFQMKVRQYRLGITTSFAGKKLNFGSRGIRINGLPVSRFLALSRAEDRDVSFAIFLQYYLYDPYDINSFHAKFTRLLSWSLESTDFISSSTLVFHSTVEGSSSQSIFARPLFSRNWAYQSNKQRKEAVETSI